MNLIGWTAAPCDRLGLVGLNMLPSNFLTLCSPCWRPWRPSLRYLCLDDTSKDLPLREHILPNGCLIVPASQPIHRSSQTVNTKTPLKSTLFCEGCVNLYANKIIVVFMIPKIKIKKEIVGARNASRITLVRGVTYRDRCSSFSVEPT